MLGRALELTRPEYIIVSGLERGEFSQLFAAVLGYDIPAEAHSGLEGLRRAKAATGPVILLHGTTWPTHSC